VSRNVLVWILQAFSVAGVAVLAMDAMAVASSISSAGLCTAPPSRNLSSCASFSTATSLLPKSAGLRRGFASLTRCIAEPSEKIGEFLGFFFVQLVIRYFFMVRLQMCRKYLV
jgi:hypothetical protein